MYRFVISLFTILWPERHRYLKDDKDMFPFRGIVHRVSQWLPSSAARSLRSRLPWARNPPAAGLHPGSAVITDAVPHVFRRASRHLMFCQNCQLAKPKSRVPADTSAVERRASRPFS